jgi:hypothetical protein
MIFFGMIDSRDEYMASVPAVVQISIGSRVINRLAQLLQYRWLFVLLNYSWLNNITPN